MTARLLTAIDTLRARRDRAAGDTGGTNPGGDFRHRHHAIPRHFSDRLNAPAPKKRSLYGLARAAMPGRFHR